MEQTGGCNVEAAVRLLGGKWRLLILRALLFRRKLRYNELLREISDISPKELTRNLRSLEQTGLVAKEGESREQYVVYHLTAIASELYPIFEQLGEWGACHKSQPTRSLGENDEESNGALQSQSRTNGGEPSLRRESVQGARAESP